MQRNIFQVMSGSTGKTYSNDIYFITEPSTTFTCRIYSSKIQEFSNFVHHYSTFHWEISRTHSFVLEIWSFSKYSLKMTVLHELCAKDNKVISQLNLFLNIVAAICLIQDIQSASFHSDYFAHLPTYYHTLPTRHFPEFKTIALKKTKIY